MQVHMRTAPSRLQLSPHVRACCCEGQVILLDLKRNKYLGVAGRHLACLAESVDGWPALPMSELRFASNASIDAATRPLLSQGLLTRRAVERSPSPAIERAKEALGAEDAIDDATLGLRRTGRMLRSAAVAALWLRFFSLHRIADAVATQRARLGPRAARPPSLDLMRGAVAAHVKLRPFVYSAQDRCLLDSLSLVGFLAQEGIFPHWVVGVRAHPFGAHSWVQSGTVVLNDHPDRVRSYQPILIV